MEPGVPFALLGTVHLLAVASWVALAGLAVARRRPATVVGTTLLVLGSLTLAVVEVATAVSFGDSDAELLTVARAVAALLLAGGLLQGALGLTPARVPTALPSVVVPLAAAPGAAALAALATAGAAAVAWSRAASLRLLAAGLGVAAVSAGLSGAVGSSDVTAVVVVVLRGVAALLVLAELIRAAQGSLLGKVVAAVLAGVLAMATAAVGVVGSVVVASYDEQARQLVREAAADRLAALNRVSDAGRAFVSVAARTPTPQQCEAARQSFTSSDTINDFVVQISVGGQTRNRCGSTPLSTSERVGLAKDRSVRAVFATGSGPNGEAGRFNVAPAALVRLAGSRPGLAALAIAPDREQAPQNVVVYGVRLDDSYTANDVSAGVYGLSFLVGGQVVASNLSERERAAVQRIADDNEIGRGLGIDPSQGLTTPARGSRPTVHFAFVTAPDGTPLGVIALSRAADLALGAQRRALTFLLSTALLATLVVGGLALLVGRRTVEPVRRLTAAAARVSAGDLRATAAVTSSDEVGTLSRTFDAMTGSLAQLTGDLRLSSTRLQAVLTSMSDGLVATDADGLITSINPAALEMVGLDLPEQALGYPLHEVLDVRDPTGASLLETGDRLLDAPGEVHRDTDDVVPVRVARTELEGSEGVAGSVLVLRDTTREREVERMKTEFLSNVSHELRTPMTSIYGYAQILAKRPGLKAEQVAKFADVMFSESVKMNRVVDLLVDVAAIEGGRMTVSPRPVDIKELLDARVAAWAKRAPTRAQDIRRKAAAGLPPVSADPTWVVKALDELLDNAVKFTPRGKAITLFATVHGDAVRVGVKDAGPGIAEADQRLLFTSFEQVDGSATRRVGGLGLGLAFVRRLAEDIGWPLTFSSVPGKGAQFALDLPVSDQPVSRAPRPGSRAARRPVPARGPAR